MQLYSCTCILQVSAVLMQANASPHAPYASQCMYMHFYAFLCKSVDYNWIPYMSVHPHTFPLCTIPCISMHFNAFPHWNGLDWNGLGPLLPYTPKGKQSHHMKGNPVRLNVGSDEPVGAFSNRTHRLRGRRCLRSTLYTAFGLYNVPLTPPVLPCNPKSAGSVACTNRRVVVLAFA